ncbi:hypothetical protein SprV_0401496800 [Sparganum proliferum]
MEAFIEIYPDMNANLLANVTRITIEKVRRIRGYGQAPQQAPAAEPGAKSNQEAQQQQQPGIPNRVIRRSSLLQQLLISKIAQKVSQMLMSSQPQPEARNSAVQSDQQCQGNSQQVTNINAANTASGPVPQQQQQQPQQWQRPDLSNAPPSHLPHGPALPVSVTAGSKRPSSSFSSSSSCAEDEEVDTVDGRFSHSVNQTSTEQSMQNASGKQSRPKKSPRKSCSNSTAEGVFVFPPRSVAAVEPVGVETEPEGNATPALSGSPLASPAGSPIIRSHSEPHLPHVDHHVPVQKLVGLSISGNEHDRGQQVLSYSAPEITDATCKGCVRCPPTPAWAPPTELRLCQPMTH